MFWGKVTSLWNLTLLSCEIKFAHIDRLNQRLKVDQEQCSSHRCMIWGGYPTDVRSGEGCPTDVRSVEGCPTDVRSAEGC